MEELKSGLKLAEEKKKAELAAINSRADALQNNIFSALRERSSFLDRRRIEAVERIWATAVELRPLEQASVAAQTIKLDKAMEVAAQQTPEGQKVREFAATISNAMGFSFEKFKPLTHVVDKERPFVSPLTWALFSTYRSVVVDPVFRFGVIKAGGSPQFIKDNSDLVEAVKEALPHQGDFIEKYGAEALAHLVDELREKLFRELTAGLSNADWNVREWEQAHRVVQALDRMADKQTARSAEDISAAVSSASKH